MPVRLYLDTARLGRMSRRAQRAQIDFVRLAGEEGCSLYWDRFLRGGFGVLAAADAEAVPRSLGLAGHPTS